MAVNFASTMRSIIKSRRSPFVISCVPMSDSRIDFSAHGTRRKWPSVHNARVAASLGARSYMIIEGEIDDCIFALQPKSQRHLYEIHTVPQSELVGAILSAEHIVELARLRIPRKIA